MSKNKPKAIHSNTYYKGFIGKILDEEMYEDVKNGTKDWEPHTKADMVAVTIPVEVFYRLMELDKAVTTIPFECEIVKEGDSDA